MRGLEQIMYNLANRTISARHHIDFRLIQEVSNEILDLLVANGNLVFFVAELLLKRLGASYGDFGVAEETDKLLFINNNR